MTLPPLGQFQGRENLFSQPKMGTGRKFTVQEKKDKSCTKWKEKSVGLRGIRTLDLRFTRPTPYHLAIRPHARNCYKIVQSFSLTCAKNRSCAPSFWFIFIGKATTGLITYRAVCPRFFRVNKLRMIWKDIQGEAWQRSEPGWVTESDLPFWSTWTSSKMLVRSAAETNKQKNLP